VHVNLSHRVVLYKAESAVCVGGVDTTLPQVHSDSRSTKASQPGASRKSPSRSPDGAKQPANNEQRHQQKPAQQQTTWASTRKQQPSDVTGKAGSRPHNQHSQQSTGDRGPAEKKKKPSSANDAARQQEDDENSQESEDGVMTKNGYLRVYKIIGE